MNTVKRTFTTFILLLALTGIAPLGVSAQETQAQADSEVQNQTRAGSDTEPAQKSGAALSAQAAVSEAKARSHQLTLKEIEYSRTGHAVKEARTRGRPSVSMQASSSILSNPQEEIAIHKGEMGYSPSPDSQHPTPFPDQDYVIMEGMEHTYFKISVALSQPLFTWGKIKKGIEVAELDQGIAEQEIESEQRQTRKNALSAYFGLLFARKSVSLLKEAESVLKNVVDDTENQYNVGTVNLETVLSAKNRKAMVTKQRIGAEEGQASARESLRYYTGRKDIASTKLSTDFRTALPELELDALTQKALRRSPELNKRRMQQKQAGIGLDIEKSGAPWRPDFNLNLNMDITGEKIPLFGANWSDTWNTNVILSIGTKMNIYDSGKSKHSIAQAEDRLKSAQTGVEATIESMRLQVQRSVETVRTSFYNMESIKSKMALHEEQYKNAEVSYRNELITRKDERLAYIQLLTTKSEAVLAAYQYEQALIELEKLIGQQLIPYGKGQAVLDN